MLHSIKKPKITIKTIISILLIMLYFLGESPLFANQNEIELFEANIRACLNQQKICTENCVRADKAHMKARQCIDVCLKKEHRCIGQSEDHLFAQE